MTLRYAFVLTKNSIMMTNAMNRAEKLYDALIEIRYSKY